MSGQPFRIPVDSLKALGGGNAAAGHAAMCDVFGCHGAGVGVVPAEKVAEIGNGNINAERKVLTRFVSMACRQRSKARAA